MSSPQLSAEHRIVCSTLGWSRRSLEDALAGSAALAFAGIDLGAHEGWAHVSPASLADGGPAEVRRQADEVQRLLDRYGLSCPSLNVGLRAPDPDEERRRLEAISDLARRLGVTVLCLGAGRRGAPIEQEVSRWQALLPVAAERGLQLTLETHTNQVTEIPAVAVELCQAVPGLGLTLDPSHYYAGPNQGAGFSAVYPFVRHVHLRDAGADWDHIQLPPGSGSVDFAAIARALAQHSYAGHFAVEYIDSIPIRAGAGQPADVPTNAARMRDLFLAVSAG
ncbi:MAG TPA: sugar phosphate isomerase/epimerase [Chloroflexota bacterium]|nr:sugar phosphate isomerase/epimerase [Chloroflexota bacterium]